MTDARNYPRIDRRGSASLESERWRIALGLNQAEVRQWLYSRGISVSNKGQLPRAAYEGFIKAHPDRFPSDTTPRAS